MKRAHAVDGTGKKQNLVRLKRIEGQIRGIHKMVEDERYCIEILAQINAVDQALRSVARELVKNHLRHCARNALTGDEPQQTEFIDELVDVLVRHRA